MRQSPQTGALRGHRLPRNPRTGKSKLLTQLEILVSGAQGTWPTRLESVEQIFLSVLLEILAYSIMVRQECLTYLPTTYPSIDSCVRYRI